MPTAKGNKLGVMVYLSPATFRAIEKTRNPYISTSAHCAMILDEVVSAQN